MHTLSILAVEATDVPGALAAADQFLDAHLDSVFDSYSFGGRWAELYPPGPALNAREDPAAFYRILSDAEAAQHADLRELREGGHDLFGTGRDLRTALTRVLSVPLHTLDHASRTELVLLGMRTQRLADLLRDRYSVHACFYDTVGYTLSARSLEVRADLAPEHQWLVIVDLHF